MQGVNEIRGSVAFGWPSGSTRKKLCSKTSLNEEQVPLGKAGPGGAWERKTYSSRKDAGTKGKKQKVAPSGGQVPRKSS